LTDTPRCRGGSPPVIAAWTPASNQFIVPLSVASPQSNRWPFSIQHSALDTAIWRVAFGISPDVAAGGNSLLFVRQSREGMEVLFTLLAERYERGGVFISSNLPFSKW